jgi:hypothetical protein
VILIDLKNPLKTACGQPFFQNVREKGWPQGCLTVVGVIV